MTNSTPIDPRREFARIALLALLSAAVLALIGFYPTAAWTGTAGTHAMVLGIAAALLGSWAGSLAPFFFLRGPLQQFPFGILAGLGVRFALTLALALAVRALVAVPETPLLLWTGIGQVAILAVDVVGLLRLARRVAEVAK